MNKLKFMKKIIIPAFLCLFLSLSLVGCGAQSMPKLSDSISLQLVTSSSAIKQKFAFPAQSTHFKDEGASDETLAAYKRELTEQIKVRVYSAFLLSYFEKYAATPNNDYLFGGGKATIDEPQYNSSTDKVEFAFNFLTPAAWEYYHPKTSADEPEQDEGGPFLDVDSSQGAFPFSQQSGESTVGEIYASILSNVQVKYFSEEALSSKPEVKFVYDYVTPYKRVRSNADMMSADENGYHHIWSSDAQGLQGKQIALKTVNAVRGWWYLVALVSAIVVTMLSCLGIYVVERRKKNKNVDKKEG